MMNLLIVLSLSVRFHNWMHHSSYIRFHRVVSFSNSLPTIYAMHTNSIPLRCLSLDGHRPMNIKRDGLTPASRVIPSLSLFALPIFVQYLYLLENVDFTLFFIVYLLIYSIFTPNLSQYFQFGYFFFFLFF